MSGHSLTRMKEEISFICFHCKNRFERNKTVETFLCENLFCEMMMIIGKSVMAIEMKSAIKFRALVLSMIRDLNDMPGLIIWIKIMQSRGGYARCEEEVERNKILGLTVRPDGLILIFDWQMTISFTYFLWDFC